MATRPNLVAVLGKKIPNFGDEPQSRHRFWLRELLYWRRDSFSPPIRLK
ncbi:MULTISPECIES: hypothetical protein [Bacillaceae]|nr:hypothetical protein [Caldibacillus thermoamylovorans]MCM3477828.1 hypothetical protein [Caldibacillus thermoamylovorans]